MGGEDNRCGYIHIGLSGGGLASSCFVTDTINPLVPDAHYSERQDKPFSLQIQRLEVDFKVKLRIFISCTLGANGSSGQVKDRSRKTIKFALRDVTRRHSRCR